jgi:hypothetical protein
MIQADCVSGPTHSNLSNYFRIPANISPLVHSLYSVQPASLSNGDVHHNPAASPTPHEEENRFVTLEFVMNARNNAGRIRPSASTDPLPPALPAPPSKHHHVRMSSTELSTPSSNVADANGGSSTLPLRRASGSGQSSRQPLKVPIASPADGYSLLNQCMSAPPRPPAKPLRAVSTEPVSQAGKT